MGKDTESHQQLQAWTLTCLLKCVFIKTIIFIFYHFNILFQNSVGI